ncbi:MAG: hypothetical protein L6R42_011348 [Xanthoria sp. 1 TBL-2021]|nr:MAG: hypothetical protein L6R42_011348 [Xanthoria sp. 1 TBL-2021]
MPTVAAKTSAYDPSFQQHLIDHGCYPTHHPDAAASVAAQPQNFTAIFTRLGMPTASSSALTMQNFYDFLNKNKQAATEKTTMSGEIRKLAGDMNIPFLENVLFNKIASLIMDSAGKESTLRRPKVDSYDGNIPTGLAKSVRDSLGTYIVPCEATDRPCLPNFFLEAKGKSGDSDVVMRQAWYAGCLGARGVHELRAWIDPNTLEDNNAYTIACSYEAGNATLIVYTIHPRLSSNKHHRRISSMPNRRYEYIMSQLYAINMRNNLAGFVEGMKIYQNARVWAKEQRDRLYAAANLKASSQDTASSESSSQESADELGMDGASS